MLPVWLVNVVRRECCRASHTRAVPSALAMTGACRPAEGRLHYRASTAGQGREGNEPCWASHTRTVPSSLTVTMRVPSGLKAAAYTGSGCRNVARSVPCWASQSRAVPSALAVTNRALSD